MAKLNEIIFKKNANPFFNGGVVGLFRMSQKFLDRRKADFPTIKVSGFENNQLKLSASSELELLQYLEDLYYFMGEVYYNTTTPKQEELNQNVYFTEKNGVLDSKRFPRMKTYGLTYLFTNDAQGTTRSESNSVKFESIKSSNPELATLIEEYFKKEGLTLQKKIYFNEPYTKITRLKVDRKFLQEGDVICPVTGEGFKTLVEAKNTSPFLSGLANFNTFLSEMEKGISWKALYAIRFAPAVCFYSYQNNYETLICHLFESDTLENLNVLYNGRMYLEKEELKQVNYSGNIRLNPFRYYRKDAEELVIDVSKDAVWASEISFMLLYNFYGIHLKSKMVEATDEEIFLDLLAEIEVLSRPITLISFKADKFASTLRPNFYEEYNHVKFVLSLIHALETGSGGKMVSIPELWSSLRFQSSRSQSTKRLDPQKAKAMERKYRAEVFEEMLNARSVLPVLERFYYEAYNNLLSGEKLGYRNYRLVFDFLTIYEKIVNMELEPEMQEFAVNLGTSIGQGILNFGDGGEDKKTSARGGRKYIIDLRNSRTLEQFLQAVERVMFRYQIGVKKELLLRINSQNFPLVKRFVVISALNQLNPVLSKN